MFWWGKKKSQLIAFGNSIADELFERVPLEILEKHLNGKSRKSTRRFENAINHAIAHIAQFKAEQKPSIYGKAKIHQSFARRLKELGYPAEFVDEINTFIIKKTP